MHTQFLPKMTGVRRIYLMFGALIIAAWGALLAWQRSPFAELLGHEALADHHIPFLSHLGAFLLSWLLMTVAMMLPASLPLLIQSPRDRTNDGWSALLTVAGYLSPWLLFGFLAFLGDNVLHEITETGAPLAGASDFIAPAILLIAGLYQFTPIKRRFTERCQPSTNIRLAEHGQQAGSGLKLGFQFGYICMGSCWPLMLIMFALGHHRLDWMLIISGIAATERFTPWSIRVTHWVGAGLIAWGVFTVIF